MGLVLCQNMFRLIGACGNFCSPTFILVCFIQNRLADITAQTQQRIKTLIFFSFFLQIKQVIEK